MSRIISILAILLSLFSTAALADAAFDFRLSPGPRLVGTRAESSGSGQVHAALTGNVLTLDGSYHGLLGAPTAANIAMGPLPGVRGPVIAQAVANDGKITARVTLNASQLKAFHAGGLYVEIDSAEAPAGDLWGWIMPPSD